MVESGIYSHYKGKRYEVVGIANHSETLEQLVIYKSLYDDPEFPKGSLWARPKAMFEENVKVDGKMVPRFSKENT